MAALEKILLSTAFRDADRMKRFLRYVVEHSLRGHDRPLREYAIGVDVFDRGAAFDPRGDPIVRVEARRLRQKLSDYYETEGTEDLLCIGLPKGGYSVVLTERAVPPAPPGAGVAPGTSTPRAKQAASRTTLWINRLAVGISAVALLSLAAIRLLGQRSSLPPPVPPPPALPVIRSLAVLPLQNLSGDPAEDYLVDGLTDALTTDLAQLHALRVISRTSAARYKTGSKPLPQIGRELHVDAIVEGSLVSSGTRVRVTAQLIDARTDIHIWAKTFEGGLRDILALQSQAAREIAEGIRASVTPDEQMRLAATRLTDPEAQESYLKGSYLLNQRTPESCRKSVELFQSAIHTDTHYARAYLGLAEAYTVLVADDVVAPERFVANAEQAARHALTLDNDLGEAYAVLAQLAFLYRWDFRAAEGQFRRSITLSPNYATAHQWYGLLLLAERRFGEASSELKIALQIDPLSLVAATDLGQVYFYSGHLDQAIDQARAILELNRDFPMAQDLLGMAYEQKGMNPEAIRAFLEYSQLTNGSVDATMHLAHVYAISGNRQQARQLLRRMQDAKAGEFRSPYDIAAVYAGLGQSEQALGWLRQALKDRAPMLVFADVDFLLGPLNADPRFGELIAEVGVPGTAR